MMDKSIYPMVAGFTAGTVSTTLLLPLDVIKVALQVHEGSEHSNNNNSKASSSFSASSSASATHRTTTTTTTTTTQQGSHHHHQHHQHRMGSWRVARNILRHEGLQGLYVGWAPAVVGSAVSWGGYFYVYEGFKSTWRNWKQQRLLLHDSSNNNNNPPEATLNALDYFVLSCAAGGVMVAITNPIWLIKTRMQLQLKKASQQHHVVPYKGMVDALQTIVRTEGFGALYRGSGAAFLLTSNGGIQFVVYETLRKHYHIQKQQGSSSSQSLSLKHTRSLTERFTTSLGYMTIGAVSKIVASTVTYPLQVAKSRMQQRADALEFTDEGQVRVVKRNYKGLVDTLGCIVRAEGISGLFKGCLPNALRVAPSAAVTFVVYELTMDLLAPSSSDRIRP